VVTDANAPRSLAGRPPTARRTSAGFTLIELLVALTVMAVLAGLSWQGVDSLLRTRESTQAALDRTARLGTVLMQWEQDFAALHETFATPALQFDGSTLRMTRTAEGGVRVVTWTVRDGAWYRWAGPVLTRAGELQQSWFGSLQHQGGEIGELQLVESAGEWQIYFWRGNAWTNAQSTGDRLSRSTTNELNALGVSLDDREQLPDGVRLVLTLPAGTLTRDILVPPQPQ
jgi:general secretion pathway protein J